MTTIKGARLMPSGRVGWYCGTDKNGQHIFLVHYGSFWRSQSMSDALFSKTVPYNLPAGVRCPL